MHLQGQHWHSLSINGLIQVMETQNLLRHVPVIADGT